MATGRGTGQAAECSQTKQALLRTKSDVFLPTPHAHIGTSLSASMRCSLAPRLRREGRRVHPSFPVRKKHIHVCQRPTENREKTVMRISSKWPSRHFRSAADVDKVVVGPTAEHIWHSSIALELFTTCLFGDFISWSDGQSSCCLGDLGGEGTTHTYYKYINK